MQVDMTLTCKLASRIAEVRKGNDEPLEASLSIKGNISDLIKIMESINKNHLFPKQEMSNVIREFLSASMLSSEHRKYVFDPHATKNHGSHTYENGELNKISCIKQIHEILGTGLKESKDFVDGCGMNLNSAQVSALRLSGIFVYLRP